MDDTPAGTRREAGPGGLGFAVLVGGVVGASVATWVAAVLALLLGAVGGFVAATSLVLGFGVAVLAGRASRPRAAALDAPSDAARPGRMARLADAAALVAFGIASARQFGSLLVSRGGELLTLLANNYGDLPLHWTYVEFLAAGAPFWPENPIIVGERLRYPFGVDLLSSLFVALGFSARTVLPALGFAGAAATAGALRRFGGTLAVAGFLFSGGLVGFQVLLTGKLVDYQDAVAWKNLYLALFVPQRGLLLAVPAGLLLLWSWRRRLLRGEEGLAPWVEGVLWGTLPLVHLHTFLVASILWATWGVAGRRLRAAMPSLGWAIAPATWSVWEVSDGFRAASLVGWAPGWVIGDANPVVFLLVNFGLFLPLAIAALAFAWREGRREDLLVLGPALALLAAMFVVRVAPWAWDNTKVMLWCYLLSLPSIGTLVLARLGAGWRAAAVLGLLFSGAVSVTAASVGPANLGVVDLAERQAVCEALAKVSVSSRVATAPTFNHPVSLCGRPIVAGYAGHLWSHGIDASRVEALLGVLMKGRQEWREAGRELGVDYLFWGRRERSDWPESARPWESETPVAQGPWGALYRLR